MSRSVRSPVLKIGVTFAQRWERGVLKDCVNMVWRMGAQVLRKKGVILSGSVTIFMSIDSRSFCPNINSRDGWVAAISHVWCNKLFLREDRVELCV